MKFQRMSFNSTSLGKKGLEGKVVAAQYVEYAKEVILRRFGEGALEQARPVYIKDRALGIEVIHPAIAEEVRRQEDGITSELNQKIGHSEVVRIQCLLPTQRDSNM